MATILPMENYRNFTVTDAFGADWAVEFKWQQNAISIRHADAVDVKFIVTVCGVEQEKVIALPHPHLLKLSAEQLRVLSDPWCCKIAATHLKQMIESSEDIERTLITVSYGEMKAAAISAEPAAVATY